MIWLYVLLGIILFFAFLLSLKANVRLEFSEELILSVSVLGIKIKILPGKDKPVKIKDYSYEKGKKWDFFDKKRPCKNELRGKSNKKRSRAFLRRLGGQDTFRIRGQNHAYNKA